MVNGNGYSNLEHFLCKECICLSSTQLGSERLLVMIVGRIQSLVSCQQNAFTLPFFLVVVIVVLV